MIQNLLVISICSLLFASARVPLTENNLKNNRDYYEVIGATTGKKIEKTLYAKERVIQTHIKTVSVIKKALANEGIDPKQIRVLLYYDGLTIRDSAPPRMWQSKLHLDTISSPWLDLTRTITTNNETEIIIRIDATAARLLVDLYSKPEDKSQIDSFLSIPTVKQSCHFKVSNEYEKYNLDRELAADKVRKIYGCVPEKLREPLLSLFQSSQLAIFDNSSFFPWSVHDQLFLHCQDEAEQYYSELYSRLAVRGLQILEDEFNPQSEWWTEIINRIKPIEECQRSNE